MLRKLIGEYRLTLRRVSKARTVATKEDKSILASCEDSLGFAIEYMEMGKHPDNRRGITRLSGTQREIPVDPHNVAFVRAVALQNQSPEVNERMQRAINDLGFVIKKLSTKELEAYSFVRGSGYSFQEAAELMKIQKGTVQILVRRAEEKIHKMVSDLTDHGIVFKHPVQIEMF